MSSSRVNCVILITLLATIVGVTALQCVEQTPCSCHFEDGSHYDLAKLAATGPFLGSANNYTWSFQPCKNVKMTLEADITKPDECKDSTGVSFCAVSMLPTSQPFSLGNTSETRWNVTDEIKPRLILVHGTRKTEIELACCATCSSKSPSFSMDAVPTPTNFHYTLISPFACKIPPPPEGLSTGSVLVILLFVFTTLYLFAGALALRFFRGAIGWEMIPNYDFWSDLPALVRDGVAFTFSGCSADSYDRI